MMATELQVAVRKVVSVNPATGEILREFECFSEGQVQSAVARARAAQVAWAEIGVRSRIAVLREFQRRLHQKKSEIAEAITREAGKPVAEALTTEVLVVLDAARFLIDNAHRLLRDEPVPHGGLATKLKSGRLVGWCASPMAWSESSRRGIIRFRFPRLRLWRLWWRGMR